MKETNLSQDYKNLIDLLAVYSEGKRRVAALELDAQEEFTGIVDGVRSAYAEAQLAVTQSEAAIKLIVLQHPEWFEEKKTVKTPYGQVQTRTTTKLEVPNEEASILLIERQGEEAEASFTHTKKSLNLEALEKLSDAQLKAYRITRVTDESVTVKEASLDLGKAVKSASKKAVKA